MSTTEQLSQAPKRLLAALPPLVAILVPTLLLIIWRLHSHFYVVFDDGEYWWQSFKLFRSLQHGGSWLEVYRFPEGRPSINFVYGVIWLLITGGGLQHTTAWMMGSFYAAFAAGIFLFTRRFCDGAGWWAAVVAVWVATQANYFMPAQIFMSEMPYLANYAFAAYFFLRSDGFRKQGWSLLSGTCGGLAICSRPAEAIVLLTLSLALLVLSQWREAQITVREAVLTAMTLVPPFLVIRAFYEPWGALPSGWIYLAPAVALTGGAIFRRSRNLRVKNLACALAVLQSVTYIWMIPRLRPEVDWFRAGTQAEHLSARDFGFSTVAHALGYIYEVLNGVVGPHIVVLVLIVLIALRYQKRGGSAVLLGAIFMLICFALPGSLVKNDSARNAIDRYFLGPILALHVGVAYAVWRLGNGRLKHLLAALVCLFAFFNIFFILDLIYWNTTSWLTQHNRWAFRSMERAQPRRGEGPNIPVIQDLGKILPAGPARLYLVDAPDGGMPEAVLNMRSLELNLPWDFQHVPRVTPPLFSLPVVPHGTSQYLLAQPGFIPGGYVVKPYSQIGSVSFDYGDHKFVYGVFRL